MILLYIFLYLYLDNIINPKNNELIIKEYKAFKKSPINVKCIVNTKTNENKNINITTNIIIKIEKIFFNIFIQQK